MFCWKQFTGLIVSAAEGNKNEEKEKQFTGLIEGAAEGNKHEENDIHVNGEQSNGKINKNEFTKSLKFSGEKPNIPVLDTVDHLMHMKNLSIELSIALCFLVNHGNWSLANVGLRQVVAVQRWLWKGTY